MLLQGLLYVVIYLIVIGGVCWLLWWLINYVGLPEPFNKIAKVIIAVIAVILCATLLLSLLPPLPHFR